MPRLDQSGSFLGPALTVLSANVKNFPRPSNKSQLNFAVISIVMSSACRRLTEGATTTAHPFLAWYLSLNTPMPSMVVQSLLKQVPFIECSSVSEVDNIEVLSVELSNVVMTSVYKPPAVDFKFLHCILQVPGKPQIIIGDFNCHSTQWGFKDSNKDGDLVEDLMDSNQLNVIHDSKLPSSFQCSLAIWIQPRPGYCHQQHRRSMPEDCDRPYPSQSAPAYCIQVNAAVRPTSVPFRRRFNYRKADWTDFSEELERKIETLLQCQATMTGLHYW